ncbi:MAG TPA: hypothetical protein VGH54_28970, partial [Mycobacterium sp.]|uniref:hypothetical protein n=1 Tax=Mycobacterium sp. TaxID=1785 RepID=UPI002F40F1F6
KFDAGPHVATKRPGGMPEYARGGVITASGTGDAVPFTVSERPHGHVSWARQYIASRYGSGGDAQ